MKMTDILKKYVLPNLPYLIFLWFFAKVGEAMRLAPGVDASTKLLGLADGFTLAFQTSMQSFGTYYANKGLYLAFEENGEAIYSNFTNEYDIEKNALLHEEKLVGEYKTLALCSL